MSNGATCHRYVPSSDVDLHQWYEKVCLVVKLRERKVKGGLLSITELGKNFVCSKFERCQIFPDEVGLF